MTTGIPSTGASKNYSMQYFLGHWIIAVLIKELFFGLSVKRGGEQKIKRKRKQNTQPNTDLT